MVGNIHEGTHSSWEFSRDGKGFGIAVVVVDSHSEDEEGIAGESGEGTSSLTSTNWILMQLPTLGQRQCPTHVVHDPDKIYPDFEKT